MVEPVSSGLVESSSLCPCCRADGKFSCSSGSPGNLAAASAVRGINSFSAVQSVSEY